MENEATWSLPKGTTPNSGETQQRFNAINLLFLENKDLNSVRNMEEEIFIHALRHHTDYQEKVTQITWNIKLNGQLLLEKYTPDVLVTLDDVTLSEGTEIGDWFDAYNNKMEMRRKLLFEDAKLDNETNGELFCRRCKSTDINIRQQQVRGAGDFCVFCIFLLLLDEAMTVFCTCNKCMLRWKM